MANAMSGSQAETPANGIVHTPPKSGFWALTIGSIGVVYGDIGTSPLYAFREASLAAAAGGVSDAEILGVLSLIFWTLICVVTLKYVVILMRADNHGEGGTLALMALVQPVVSRSRGGILLLGIVAAALFYGDAMLTPALSVLSAVEGLEIAAPALADYVLPISILILVGLFLVQYRGTASVATFFGPLTCIWFAILGLLGVVHIASNPDVLAALNPIHGIAFLGDHGAVGLVTLGAVFLAVTGAEALYADLGHFGRKPIQMAWIFFVLPALVLNYFGQGALVLDRPKAMSNPFFHMAPNWAQLPLVILATAATVIAAQAVITGAYSLSRQAIQLGLLPRLEVRHTSEAHPGQIYLPRINTILLIGVVLLVGLFRTSGALAGAYGIAVSGTMVVTAILLFLVIWKVWRWGLIPALLIVVPLLAVDSTFLFANLLKIVDGGWFPLALGVIITTIMLTWWRGSHILFDKTRRQEIPLGGLIEKLEAKPPPRVAGTAVFLTSDPESTPTALLHSLKHFKVLHEHNVILTVKTVEAPRVPASERVSMEPLSRTFARVTLRYGFAEQPNVPKALGLARQKGWSFDIMATSFFLSRRSLRPAPGGAMPMWQDRLFIGLSRSADDASSYFRIPTNRVVEIGTQVVV